MIVYSSIARGAYPSHHLRQKWAKKRSQSRIQTGSEPSSRNLKRPFKIMMPACRPVRSLLLPFHIVQLQHIQLQILSRRRYAMKIRRHYHSSVPLAKPRRCAMPLRSLLLPLQKKFHCFMILSLATPRRRAMNIRRHCHITSEQIGCPLKRGVAPAPPQESIAATGARSCRAFCGVASCRQSPSCHCRQALAVSRLRLRSRKNSPGARRLVA